jgi:hypothetical protein
MTFLCTHCAAPAMAVRPGTAPETCELLGTVLVLNAGEPSEAWCETCWKARFGRKAA